MKDGKKGQGSGVDLAGFQGDSSIEGHGCAHAPIGEGVYRQAELQMEQKYTQIRMQVVNAMYALTNDRAQVNAASAARDYAQQSLDAEQKKLHLGASTTANVLQQQRNLATANDNLIAAHAAYAKDRATLYEILASTLQHYGINLPEAAAGKVTAAPVIPGVEPAKPGNEPAMTAPMPAPAQ